MFWRRTGGALLVVVAAATLGLCAPPKLDIPAQVKPTGQYVTIVPDTDAVSVTYVGLSGEEPFPSAILNDRRQFVLPVRGLKDGTYKFVAIGAGATGEQTRRDFAVVIGTGGDVIPDPVKPDPVKPDPVNPSAYLTPPLYVIVVEETAQRTPAQGKVIADSAMWARLKAAGHKFKILDRSDPLVSALKLDVMADKTGVPAVVVRDAKGVDRAFALPATSAEIETTAKGFLKP